jgi:hypothetical protein
MRINVNRSWRRSLNEKLLLALMFLIAAVILIGSNQDLGSTTSLINSESQGLFSFFSDDAITGAAIGVAPVEEVVVVEIITEDPIEEIIVVPVENPVKETIVVEPIDNNTPP